MDKIERLEKKMSGLKNNKITKIKNNTNNTNNTNIINIIPFKNIDATEIISELYAKNPVSVINADPGKLVKYIYYNKNHPERHNIFIKNVRSPSAFIVVEANGLPVWQIDNITNVIDKLVCNVFGAKYDIIESITPKTSRILNAMELYEDIQSHIPGFNDNDFQKIKGIKNRAGNKIKYNCINVKCGLTSNDIGNTAIIK
jgi:hypothetical protein